MPRLSGDIDLTYLPLEDRITSLRHIDEALDRIVGAISARRPRYRLKRLGDIATFLLSLHDAEPHFDLIGFPRAALLPAVRWKLANLAELMRKDPEKHVAQRNALKDLFR